MMLAHFLWEATPPGRTAHEDHWVRARDTALAHAAGYLAATWRSWPTNERRVALALATTPEGPYGATARARFGIKKSSVRHALQSLLNRADAVHRDGGHPVLTDPLLELWLQRHAREWSPLAGASRVRYRPPGTLVP